MKGSKLKDVSVFIAEINKLALSEDIVDRTIKIRKSMSIKLPDAIIAATAIVHDITLLSDNTKISVVFPD